jgi:hypothetical protein
MLAAVLVLLTLPVALTTAFSLQSWARFERPWQFVMVSLVLGYTLMAILGWWAFGRFLTAIGVAGVRPGTNVPPQPWWETLHGRWWLLVGAYVVLGSLLLAVLRHMMRTKL